MDWTEALERRVAFTRNERYRLLCDESHPDHLAYRASVVEMESGGPPPVPSFPPLIVQAGNALGAISRAAGAVFAGEPLRVSDEVLERRRGVCAGCPSLVDQRCVECGCYYAIKIQLATEGCPLGHWEADK